jgi:hypothetical protein
MNDQHDEVIGKPEGIHGTARPGWAEEGQQTERLFRQLLDGSRVLEQLYPEVLGHCRRQDISERQLWHGLAVYRQTGSFGCPVLPWADLTLFSRQKLSRRILSLIGQLPPESLQEFRALVALTATFLDRAQFVCDLVVYLYTEREKGARWAGSEGRLYIEFFVEKLMWELDVVRRSAEQHPLEQLNEEYAAWLCDRIMDGEVLI